MTQLCIVALNPAVDVEWRVEDVLWEEKNVVHQQRRWAGGKGVNVARWLKLLGAHSELFIPLGGATGREMSRKLRAEGLRARIVRLHEETRVNVVVTIATGRQMRFNPRGPKLTRSEWQRFLQLAKQRLTRDVALVLSGALPRGVPDNAYAQLIRIAHGSGCRTFLDCDGPAFAAAVAEKPFLVKPNLHELSLWTGKNLRSAKEIRVVAWALSRKTCGWVLVSLGEKGALLVNARRRFALRASPPTVAVRNTLGAGDALLAAAAAMAARDAEPTQWLCAAVAAGTAATQCEAGSLPSMARVRQLATRVRLERVYSLPGLATATP